MRSFWPALMGAEQPSLEERSDTMGTWQHRVGEFTGASDDLPLVDLPGGGQSAVGGPAVGDDARARCHSIPDEGQQAFRRRVPNPLQADAPARGPADLDGDRDEDLLSDVASPATFFDAPDERPR